MALASRLLEHWAGFCSRTGLHGLAYYFCARNRVELYFWVIVTLVSLTWGVVVIVEAFTFWTSHPIEPTLHSVPSAGHLVFPTVTLCINEESEPDQIIAEAANAYKFKCHKDANDCRDSQGLKDHFQAFLELLMVYIEEHTLTIKGDLDPSVIFSYLAMCSAFHKIFLFTENEFLLHICKITDLYPLVLTPVKGTLALDSVLGHTLLSTVAEQLENSNHDVNFRVNKSVIITLPKDAYEYTSTHFQEIVIHFWERLLKVKVLDTDCIHLTRVDHDCYYLGPNNEHIWQPYNAYKHDSKIYLNNTDSDGSSLEALQELDKDLDKIGFLLDTVEHNYRNLFLEIEPQHVATLGKLLHFTKKLFFRHGLDSMHGIGSLFKWYWPQLYNYAAKTSDTAIIEEIEQRFRDFDKDHFKVSPYELYDYVEEIGKENKSIPYDMTHLPDILEVMKYMRTSLSSNESISNSHVINLGRFTQADSACINNSWVYVELDRAEPEWTDQHYLDLLHGEKSLMVNKAVLVGENWPYGAAKNRSDNVCVAPKQRLVQNMRHCSLITSDDQVDCSQDFAPVMTSEGICFQLNGLPMTDVLKPSTALDILQRAYNPQGFATVRSADGNQLTLILDSQGFYSMPKLNHEKIIHLGLSNEYDSLYLDSYSTFGFGLTVQIIVYMQSVDTSPNVEKLSIEDRQCRYRHEVNTRQSSMFEYYTKKTCQFSCILEQVKQNFSCVPWDLFFNADPDSAICSAKEAIQFHQQMSNKETSKVCHRDSHCLADCRGNMYEAQINRFVTNAVQSCRVEYIFKAIFDKEPFLGYAHIKAFQDGYIRSTESALKEYCRTKLSEDVTIFHVDLSKQNVLQTYWEIAATDLEKLSLLGGTLGLFMGFSMLVWAEIVYILMKFMIPNLRPLVDKEGTLWSLFSMSTLHGMVYIRLKEKWPITAYWVLTVIAALCIGFILSSDMLAFMLASHTERYLFLDAAFVHSLPFPTVTICAEQLPDQWNAARVLLNALDSGENSSLRNHMSDFLEAVDDHEWQHHRPENIMDTRLKAAALGLDSVEQLVASDKKFYKATRHYGPTSLIGVSHAHLSQCTALQCIIRMPGHEDERLVTDITPRLIKTEYDYSRDQFNSDVKVSFYQEQEDFLSGEHYIVRLLNHTLYWNIYLPYVWNFQKMKTPEQFASYQKSSKTRHTMLLEEPVLVFSLHIYRILPWTQGHFIHVFCDGQQAMSIAFPPPKTLGADYIEDVQLDEPKWCTKIHLDVTMLSIDIELSINRFHAPKLEDESGGVEPLVLANLANGRVPVLGAYAQKGLNSHLELRMSFETRIHVYTVGFTRYMFNLDPDVYEPEASIICEGSQAQRMNLVSKTYTQTMTQFINDDPKRPDKMITDINRLEHMFALPSPCQLSSHITVHLGPKVELPAHLLAQDQSQLLSITMNQGGPEVPGLLFEPLLPTAVQCRNEARCAEALLKKQIASKFEGKGNMGSFIQYFAETVVSGTFHPFYPMLDENKMIIEYIPPMETDILALLMDLLNSLFGEDLQIPIHELAMLLENIPQTSMSRGSSATKREIGAMMPAYTHYLTWLDTVTEHHQKGIEYYSSMQNLLISTFMPMLPYFGSHLLEYFEVMVDKLSHKVNSSTPGDGQVISAYLTSNLGLNYTKMFYEENVYGKRLQSRLEPIMKVMRLSMVLGNLPLDVENFLDIYTGTSVYSTELTHQDQAHVARVLSRDLKRLDLLQSCHFAKYLDSGDCSPKFSHIISDQGICTSLNAIANEVVYKVEKSSFLESFEQVFSAPSLKDAVKVQEYGKEVHLILDTHQTEVFGSDRGAFSIGINQYQDALDTFSSNLILLPGEKARIQVIVSKHEIQPNAMDLNIALRECHRPYEHVNQDSIFRTYTRKSCLFECILRNVSSIMNCTPWDMMVIPGQDVPICTRDDSVAYKAKFMAYSATRLHCTTLCPEACDGLVYEMQLDSFRTDPQLECTDPDILEIAVSGLSDPLDAFYWEYSHTNYWYYKHHDSNGATDHISRCQHKVRQDLAWLSIKLVNDYVDITQISRKFYTIDYIGITGGNLGLFTGLSLMTFIEVFYWLYVLVTRMLCI